MRKKAIIVLVGISIISGMATTSYAEGLNNINSKVTVQNKVEKKEINYKKEKIKRKEFIKEELEKGKTVQEIKIELEDKLKTNLEKEVKENKITTEKSNSIKEKKLENIEKTNILKGVVKNKDIMESLNKGETLNLAKENFIKIKTSEINKLVSEKKISEEKGKEKINKITEKMDKNEGVFMLNKKIKN